jgi:hypothetical protein
MIRVRTLKDWLSVASSSAAIACAGRIASNASPGDAVAAEASVQDGVQDGDAAEDIYGAAFEGDAGQCAAVICSGSQVCCVVSIESDAATPHPNNKCDYDCVARCMDSCPAVVLGQTGGGPVAAFDGGHGGAIRLPGGDASDD